MKTKKKNGIEEEVEKQMKKLIDYLEEKFPKGETDKRGAAIVLIALAEEALVDIAKKARAEERKRIFRELPKELTAQLLKKHINIIVGDEFTKHNIKEFCTGYEVARRELTQIINKK